MHFRRRDRDLYLHLVGVGELGFRSKNECHVAAMHHLNRHSVKSIKSNKSSK